MDLGPVSEQAHHNLREGEGGGGGGGGQSKSIRQAQVVGTKEEHKAGPGSGSKGRALGRPR